MALIRGEALISMCIPKGAAPIWGLALIKGNTVSNFSYIQRKSAFFSGLLILCCISKKFSFTGTLFKNFRTLPMISRLHSEKNEISWKHLHSVLGRIKCMCGSSHTLVYGCVRSCVIHNSSALNYGDISRACHTN